MIVALRRHFPIASPPKTKSRFGRRLEVEALEARLVFNHGLMVTAPGILEPDSGSSSSNLVISAAPTGVFPQFTLVDPQGSGYFGAQVVPLSTGNIVVTDSTGNGGAAYLFNGRTGALISALTGLGDGPTATALTNGNYVVDSPEWKGGMGAVTWGSGTTGVSGTPSAANSLIGSTPFDYVGGPGGTGGVTALPNGNYVVDSPDWGSDGLQSYGLGAVTWGNGATGTSGVVSAANSLVGATQLDHVGKTAGIGSGVTALTNGNYVVDSPYWGSVISDGTGPGAVTWGNGAIGTSGVVSASNSLVGTTVSNASGGGDLVGSGGVKALTNGNYVVDSEEWNGNEGAVTWGNGASGISGVVSATNSLVGSNAYPSSSAADLVGSGGITALTNGNYVVDSPNWAVDSSNPMVGAVTWGNGATGIAGPVSTANSLVGSNPDDQIGGVDNQFIGVVGGTGVTALSNGNYVVNSPDWGVTLSENAGGGAVPLGAVTWESGTAPAVGKVSAANSLIGYDPGVSATQVGGGGEAGNGGVTALTNGNYLVTSWEWSDGEGAVTWGNGTTGITGTISAANSLVGSFLGDHIGGGVIGGGDTGGGEGGVIALSNGNYVVNSPNWLKQTGAVTWVNGTTGLSGTVSADNSLVGDAPGDEIGGSGGGNVTALTNGNYVVLSPAKGTATWGNGTTGIKGTLSSVNSLGGTAADPSIGVGEVSPLPNGNYVVVVNSGDNGNGLQASDTWVDGTTGATLDGQNTIDAQNSLMGVAGAIPLLGGSEFVATDAFAGLVRIGFTDPNLLTAGFAQGQTIAVTPDFVTRTLNAGTNIALQVSGDLTVSSPIVETPAGTAGSLTLQAGNHLSLQAPIDTASGNLSLEGPLAIAIDGTNPGDGVAAGSYTQVSDTGPIHLTNASLSLTHNTATAAGTTFIILQSAVGISGTFQGLGEGATVVAPDGTQFTISYQGDGGKEVVLTQLSGPSVTGTTTTLATSATSVGSGQSVTFTATVTPGQGTLDGGTVDFRDGPTDLGSAPVGAGGVATFATALPVGTHSITAVYSGDPSFLGSTSAAVGVTVALKPPPPPPPIRGDVTALADVTLTSASTSKKGKSGGFLQTLTIRNTGEQSLEGPFDIVLRGLKSSVKVRGAVGSVGPRKHRSPVVVLHVSGGMLQPGHTASLALQFTGKPNQFTVSVYANAPPR
jgi:hypothetical protein